MKIKVPLNRLFCFLHPLEDPLRDAFAHPDKPLCLPGLEGESVEYCEDIGVDSFSLLVAVEYAHLAGLLGTHTLAYAYAI